MSIKFTKKEVPYIPKAMDEMYRQSIRWHIAVFVIGLLLIILMIFILQFLYSWYGMDQINLNNK